MSKRLLYIKYFRFIKHRVWGSTEKYRVKLKEDLVAIREGLQQEGRNNKDMLLAYQRFTLNKASSEEMRLANKQFVEFLKSLGLGVIVVLPFSPITIPLIVKLGKKYGIDVLPSSFNGSSEEVKPSDAKTTDS